jgi:hypothetical protein
MPAAATMGVRRAPAVGEEMPAKAELWLKEWCELDALATEAPFAWTKAGADIRLCGSWRFGGLGRRLPPPMPTEIII